MKNINILFLGGAKRNSLAEAFIESGKNLGYEINIFSYELDKYVPISFLAKVIIGKKWEDNNVYYHLKTIIEKNKINIVLPFVDPAVLVASKLKRILTNQDVFIPVSSLELVDIFYNKLKSNDWCIKNNFRVPPQNNEYPQIAKPIRGSASKGIIVLKDNKELKRINKDDYLIQKYINGDEYTIDCYVSPISKKIITIVPRIRLDVQGGESIKSITKKDKQMINFAKKVLKKSKLIGPVTIQVIKEKNSNKIYFMELNPRFGGAVLTSIGAGANIPLYLLKDYLKIDMEYTEGWENNLLMIRRFKEYYIYANNY